MTLSGEVFSFRVSICIFVFFVIFGVRDICFILSLRWVLYFVFNGLKMIGALGFAEAGT